MKEKELEEKNGKDMEEMFMEQAKVFLLEQQQENVMNRLVENFINQIQETQAIQDKVAALEMMMNLLMGFLSQEMYKQLKEQDLFNIFNELHSFMRHLLDLENQQLEDNIEQ